MRTQTHSNKKKFLSLQLSSDEEEQIVIEGGFELQIEGPLNFMLNWPKVEQENLQWRIICLSSWVWMNHVVR